MRDHALPNCGGQAQGAGNGYFVRIYIYNTPDAFAPSPLTTIQTDLVRGDQLAFDQWNNICLASFAGYQSYPPTVKCYDSSGTVVHDYAGALANATGRTGLVQPAGIAFGNTGRLFVSSVFSGDVVAEGTPYGAISTIATHLVSDVQFVTFDSMNNLYVTSYHHPGARFPGPDCTDLNSACKAACWYYDCQDNDFDSDVIYRISSGGSIVPFITDHIYGPHQMIFATLAGCAEG